MNLIDPESRASRLMRIAARTMVAGAISVTILITLSLGRRGFLPSYRRDFCLDMWRNESGRVVIRDSGIDAHNPSPPPQGVTRYFVMESSMGRTTPLSYEWRASHWRISAGMDATGEWISKPDGSHVSGSDIHEALVSYMETRVIPDSPPMKVWPDANGEARRDREPLRWSMFQRRERILLLVFCIAASVATGVAISFMLIWPRRMQVRHSEG